MFPKEAKVNLGMARPSGRYGHMAPPVGCVGCGCEREETQGRRFRSAKLRSYPPTFSGCWKWHPSFGTKVSEFSCSCKS